MTPTTETRTYRVEGMTCDHCVLSVKEEVADVACVDEVTVELASGRMIVSGSGFGDTAIQAAVEEAGYELSS
jgi:copper chaperone